MSFPYREMMRLPIHVEDIAEAFVRVSLVDRSEYPVYNSGGTAISLGDLAEMVRGYLPDAQISFDHEGGREHSGNYLVDNSRLLSEFELTYAPCSSVSSKSSTKSAPTRACRRCAADGGRLRLPPYRTAHIMRSYSLA